MHSIELKADNRYQAITMAHHALLIIPKRKTADLDQLAESLKLLNSTKPKHLIFCGDFNFPNINCKTLSISGAPNV